MEDVPESTNRAASQTPAANTVPCADAYGLLDKWITPAAQSLGRVPLKLGKTYGATQGVYGWVMRDGTVRTIGAGTNYALGIGWTGDRSLPTLPPFPPNLGSTVTVSELHISGQSMYALMSNGDVYAWGNNSYGQLGMGNTTNVQFPTKVPGLSNVLQIALLKADGTNYAYVPAYARTAGAIYAAGYNAQGQLGVGDQVNKSSFTAITGTAGWLDVITGCNANGACFFINASNAPYACGYNANGALGLNDTNIRTTPQAVLNGTTCVKVFPEGDNTGGQRSTLWLRSNGDVWGSGANASGELGIGNNTQQNQPVRITTNFGVCSYLAFAGGNYPHAVAVLNHGTVRTWGYGGVGQLGLNNTTNYNTPQTVSITGSPVFGAAPWAFGRQAYGSSWLKDSNGNAYSCGYNGYGGVGQGNASAAQTYQKVPGICFPQSATLSDIQVVNYDASFGIVFLLSDGRSLACGRDISGVFANGATHDVGNQYAPAICIF